MSIEARLNTHNSSHGEHPEPQQENSQDMSSASFLIGISFLEDVHSSGRKGKEEERGTERENAGEPLA